MQNNFTNYFKMTTIKCINKHRVYNNKIPVLNINYAIFAKYARVQMTGKQYANIKIGES